MSIDLLEIKNKIRKINDFPKKGILFYDITTVLNSPEHLRFIIDEMAKKVMNLDFDLIICPESRGFIFGVPLSYKLNKGFVYTLCIYKAKNHPKK